jgi:AcrR family transcriptional regulator
VTKVIKATATLKDRHNAITRELILESAVDELEEGAAEALTMRNIARRSNIAERTLFRHFSTREELLDALAVSVAKRLGAPALTMDVARLPDAVQELYNAFEAHANLAKAALHGELFHRIRETVARERWTAVKTLVDKAAPHLSEHDRRLTAANIRFVLSATSWHYYRFYFGLNLQHSIEAARLVIEQALQGLAAKQRA